MRPCKQATLLQVAVLTFAVMPASSEVNLANDRFLAIEVRATLGKKV